MADETTKAPTEEAPEFGTVSLSGIPISDCERWIEDGAHVIRSLEFDVTAGHADFQQAVDKFGEMAEDLWIYLSELETITENENATFLALAPRFLEIYKELERREEARMRRVITISWWRRGEHLRSWQSLSTRPKGSSQPSLA